ncbi:MAG: OB-fold domain-containing protein [Rhodospirillaceae bacterium]|nr:OB-fold domain-containing protein [Rhodospirillaceae bacterium]
MATSQRVMTHFDKPMWASIERGRLELQACLDCGQFRYPPGPACPHCLSMQAEWRAVSGRATILSWVVFHKTYFDDHPAPYNAIAVRLEEGPIVVTTLAGEPPRGSWIGKEVEFCYELHAGRMQHKARLRHVGPLQAGAAA